MSTVVAICFLAAGFFLAIPYDHPHRVSLGGALIFLGALLDLIGK